MPLCRLGEKQKLNFKFEFQCSVILKIEKSFSFMFYVLTSIENHLVLCFMP